MKSVPVKTIPPVSTGFFGQTIQRRLRLKLVVATLLVSVTACSSPRLETGQRVRINQDDNVYTTITSERYIDGEFKVVAQQEAFSKDFRKQYVLLTELPAHVRLHYVQAFLRYLDLYPNTPRGREILDRCCFEIQPGDVARLSLRNAWLIDFEATTNPKDPVVFQFKYTHEIKKFFESTSIDELVTTQEWCPIGTEALVMEDEGADEDRLVRIALQDGPLKGATCLVPAQFLEVESDPFPVD